MDLVLMLLLDLLLLHWESQWIWLFAVYWGVLAAVGLGFAYWVNLPHLNHRRLHLNRLLFRLTFIIFLISLICTLLRTFILNIIYRTLRILGLQWSNQWRLVDLLWVARSGDGATHRHVVGRADGATHLPVADRGHVVAGGEEHWVDVIQMHLLELRVLHVVQLSSWIKLSGCLVSIMYVLRMILMCAIINTHKRLQTSQASHRPNNRFAVDNILVQITFHHLISILSPAFSWRNIAHLFTNHHIKLLLLLLVQLARILWICIWNQINRWRI